MSERDELENIVHDAMYPGYDRDDRMTWPRSIFDAATAIFAAGYRKPRVVTTVEELDALPAKSAILDRDGTPWVGDGDKVEPWASVCEDPYGGPIWKNSIDITLPATVLHEGNTP